MVGAAIADPGLTAVAGATADFGAATWLVSGAIAALRVCAAFKACAPASWLSGGFGVAGAATDVALRGSLVVLVSVTMPIGASPAVGAAYCLLSAASASVSSVMNCPRSA